MGTSALTVSALGVGITVALGDELSEDEKELVRIAWAPAAQEGRPTDLFLTAGVTTAAEPRVYDIMGGDFRSLASMLSTRITLAAIERRKSELIMLHACGVADGEGRVAAFVGPSGRGKTTLASKLGREWGYVTDETVGIDRDGRVLPYRKPLSIIDQEAVGADKTQVSADEIGLLPLPDALLAISAIVLIDRSHSHSAPLVTDVPLIDALVQLVPEMSYLPQLERPLQRVAALIERVGGIRKVSYRESDHLVPLLSSLVGRRQAFPEGIEWEVVDRAASDPSSVAEGDRDEFHRVVPLDAIRSGSCYVLLHADQVHVLDGIGPTIWDALVTARSQDEIAVAVVEALGAPSGSSASQLVSLALDALVESGIVKQHVRTAAS
jgi:hypothetical protein